MKAEGPSFVLSTADRLNVTGPNYGQAMMFAELIPAVLVLLVGLFLGWFVARRSQQSVDAHNSEVASTLSDAVELLRSERSEMMQSNIDTVLNVASHKLGDQLAVGKQVIDRERDSLASQVDDVQGELRRVGDLVTGLQKDRAVQSGQLQERLVQTSQITAALNDTTRSLQQALASPKSRGQWGERMAEDVLRAAGFVEDINYRKQTKAAGGGIPDYTFDLPNGHLVHMDVKFPIDNYLRWLEAETSQEREGFAKTFRRDVRQRVKDLSTRNYIDPETTLDYMLLFVPNESVYGFLHEHDPELVDLALRQKVVLCSPTSLFAVLAVIRQAVDNFLVERQSNEILNALTGLRMQWQRWSDPMGKMKRGLESAQKAYDDLAGPRTREFERQLQKLEDFRDDDGEQKLSNPGDPESATAESQTIGVLKSA